MNGAPLTIAVAMSGGVDSSTVAAMLRDQGHVRSDRRLVTLFGPLIAAAVAVLGWYMAHRFNTTRDRMNKRHDMITQYLLEAYRRLEMAANREGCMTDEQAIAFESAIGDIQLLGSTDQITTTVQYLKTYGKARDDLQPLLRLLRNDLRKELGLSSVETPPMFFRFERDRDSRQLATNQTARVEKRHPHR